MIRAAPRMTHRRPSEPGILPIVDIAALTARCRETVAALDLPRPFDVRTLCARVGQRRGRPIALLGMALPPDGPAGLWISTDRGDYIVFENTTSPLHQEHIILHELGHLLLGHAGAAGLSDAQVRRMFPELNADVVRRVLGRGGYSTEEEQEAEMLASMIVRLADRHRRAPRVTDPVSAGRLWRLEAGL